MRRSSRRCRTRTRPRLLAGLFPERINPGDHTHRLPDILQITSGSTWPPADFVDAPGRRHHLRRHPPRLDDSRRQRRRSSREDSSATSTSPWSTNWRCCSFTLGINAPQVLAAITASGTSCPPVWWAVTAAASTVLPHHRAREVRITKVIHSRPADQRPDGAIRHSRSGSCRLLAGAHRHVAGAQVLCSAWRSGELP